MHKHSDYRKTVLFESPFSSYTTAAASVPRSWVYLALPIQKHSFVLYYLAVHVSLRVSIPNEETVLVTTVA